MSIPKYTLTPEREAQVETSIVEEVFGLTGGELNDESWGGFAYNYDDVLEYACDDEWDADATYKTVLQIDSYSKPPETITVDGEVWTYVRGYSHSGEAECPGQHDDSHGMARWPERNKVRRDQCKLVRGKAMCVMCEERIGSQHGYLYLGQCFENVYRLEVASEADTE